MPIVLAPNLVLNDNGINADNPIIGYDNRVTIANVSADFTLSGYPASNLANPSTALGWKSDTFADQYIYVDLASNTSNVDYLAIAKHNFGSIKAVVSVEADTGGGTWVRVVSKQTLSDDTPAIFRFTSYPYAGVRLLVEVRDIVVNPQLAILFVGKLLEMPRRIYVGHAPLNLASAANVSNGTSESGNFLGRIVLGETAATSASFQNLPAAWVRQYLNPFLKSAQESPFFWAWRPSGYPREMGYCWLTNAPKPANQRANGMMQVDFQMSGIIS